VQRLLEQAQEIVSGDNDLEDAYQQIDEAIDRLEESTLATDEALSNLGGESS
jgi:hypothetical protein